MNFSRDDIYLSELKKKKKRLRYCKYTERDSHKGSLEKISPRGDNLLILELWVENPLEILQAEDISKAIVSCLGLTIGWRPCLPNSRKTTSQYTYI